MSFFVRNPTDHKPSLDFPILGYDISLMDSKDSRKSYCIKISHPSQDTYFFATDSRISIERWIEVLSLAATGRLDVIAPYPPYFCAEQSGDELKSRSRESLLSCEVRLILIQLCSRRIQPSLPPPPHLHHCRTLPPQRKRKEGTAVLFAGETSAIRPPKKSMLFPYISVPIWRPVLKM